MDDDAKKAKVREETLRRYYEKNRETVLERQKVYRESHTAQETTRKREWNAANPERRREIERRSREKNREAYLAGKAARREACRNDPDCVSRVREQQRVRQRQQRLEVIAHYGGACACCGETTFEFLAIDHINGGGTEDRRTNGPLVAARVIRQGFPDHYRILCHNCNQAIGCYGSCPHQGSSSPTVP